MNFEKTAKFVITLLLSNAALYVGFYGADNLPLLITGVVLLAAAVGVVAMLLSRRQQKARRHPRESAPVVKPKSRPAPLAQAAKSGFDHKVTGQGAWQDKISPQSGSSARPGGATTPRG